MSVSNGIFVQITI